MRAELIKGIETIKAKLEELDRWLAHNWNHPDRHKVISDRNHFSVKLETTKRKLYNLDNGHPLLGYAAGIPDGSVSLEQRKKTHH